MHAIKLILTTPSQAYVLQL